VAVKHLNREPNEPPRRQERQDQKERRRKESGQCFSFSLISPLSNVLFFYFSLSGLGVLGVLAVQFGADILTC
jgi:hypothetical protein